jgi:class 3 adenylate cyclase
MTDHSEDVERGELVYKASHCCLTLLTKWGNYDINIPDCATKTLRIHLGIGAGLISDIIVGGSPGRWEHLIAGDGINQLSTVLDLAKAGELALSHQALKWLGWVVDIRSLNLGNYDKKCIILTGLAKAERRIAEKTEKVTDALSKITDEKLAAKIANMYKCFMDRTAMFKLQSDVHQSNLFQLDARLEELLNLTELRQITTIFIKIGSLQSTEADEFLEPCQNAIQAVQNALVRCDGSLRQFHVDDKGAVILCFFGLPPLAHENDSKLGISAGIEIREKFLDLFEEFAIGITTGVVSFGGVGAEGRAEYAVVFTHLTRWEMRLIWLPD